MQFKLILMFKNNQDTNDKYNQFIKKEKTTNALKKIVILITVYYEIKS